MSEIVVVRDDECSRVADRLSVGDGKDLLELRIAVTDRDADIVVDRVRSRDFDANVADVEWLAVRLGQVSDVVSVSDSVDDKDLDLATGDLDGDSEATDAVRLLVGEKLSKSERLRVGIRVCVRPFVSDLVLDSERREDGDDVPVLAS